MADTYISIGKPPHNKKLHDFGDGTYGDAVYVSGMVADVDLDIEASDLGAGAEGAALGNGVLMQADDGTDRQNLQLDNDTGGLKVLGVAGTALIGKVGIDQTTPGTTDGVTVKTIVIPAETVVAGAASTLGKIGTIAAAATLFVRCPCAAANPATARVKWRVSANKAYTVTKYLARTILNAPTITLASVQVDDTVIVNGLTYTAKAAENLAARQFNQSGTNIETATSLAACINVATYGVPGVTAASGGTAIVTLTATTATTTQCVTGVGGVRIICAQTLPLALDREGDPNTNPVTNATAAGNSLTNGDLYDQYVDGYPQAYLGIQNNHAADAMTLVVGATLLSW